MNLRDINNYFGDMDLFLMDLILKGKVPEKGKVLDLGCGQGRNGLYFIQNGYEYHGWDKDASMINLLAYLAKEIRGAKTYFKETDFTLLDTNQKFDLVVCSRVLHFAQSEEMFYTMWEKLVSLLNPGAIIYMSMDSSINNTLGKKLENGLTEFLDSKVRFTLSSDIYENIKKGFEEIEPLRTLVHHNERAQSFIAFKKV